MNVNIVKGLCIGPARCHAAGPDAFPLDDLGFVDIEGVRDIPADLEKQARSGVAACPERALTALED